MRSELEIELSETMNLNDNESYLFVVISLGLDFLKL